MTSLWWSILMGKSSLPKKNLKVFLIKQLLRKYLSLCLWAQLSSNRELKVLWKTLRVIFLIHELMVLSILPMVMSCLWMKRANPLDLCLKHLQILMLGAWVLWKCCRAIWSQAWNLLTHEQRKKSAWAICTWWWAKKLMMLKALKRETSSLFLKWTKLKLAIRFPYQASLRSTHYRCLFLCILLPFKQRTRRMKTSWAPSFLSRRKLIQLSG